MELSILFGCEISFVLNRQSERITKSEDNSGAGRRCETQWASLNLFFNIQLQNESMPGLANRNRTVRVIMRSLAGDPDEPEYYDNQLVLYLDVDEGAWETVKLDTIETNGEWVIKRSE